MAYSTTAGHDAQQMQFLSYSRFLRDRFLRDSLYLELDSSIQEFAQFFAYILDLMNDEELAYLYSANTIGRTSYLPLSIYGIALYMHHSRRETVKDTLAAIRISPQLQKVLFLTSVPSEATMSKRVKELIGKIGQRRMAESICKDAIILNASIDSSICEAREKAINRKKEAAAAGCVQEETAEVKAKRGKGRPKNGSAEEKAIAERRAAEAKAYEEKRKRNIGLSPDALLDELGLEMRCSWTAKTNSKGKRQWFRGYKIHILTDDNGRIAAYHITGACVHDSRVAVYLMKRFANFCY